MMRANGNRGGGLAERVSERFDVLAGD
jgi:hypothetical protein